MVQVIKKRLSTSQKRLLRLRRGFRLVGIDGGERGVEGVVVRFIELKSEIVWIEGSEDMLSICCEEVMGQFGRSKHRELALERRVERWVELWSLIERIVLLWEVYAKSLVPKKVSNVFAILHKHR